MIVSGVKGVMREAWKMGLISDPVYLRISAEENARSGSLPTARGGWRSYGIADRTATVYAWAGFYSVLIGDYRGFVGLTFLLLVEMIG